MKTITFLLALLLAGCAGGQLVVTEKSGKVWKKDVQDARYNKAAQLLEWQDDAGQWHSVDATSALYEGWYGGE
jgi:hypothetical protein